MKLNKRAILKSVNENLKLYRVRFNAEWQEWQVLSNVHPKAHYAYMTPCSGMVDAIETAMHLERTTFQVGPCAYLVTR